MIYIVCSTGEGVDYAVQIDAVYTNRASAITKCRKLNHKWGGHWVWEFKEGQSYGKAKHIFPTYIATAASPPEIVCQCGAELCWDTEYGGSWMHVDAGVAPDHDPLPKDQPIHTDTRVVIGSIDDIKPPLRY